MKKTLAKGLALAFIGSLFMAGSAMAMSVIDGDYWYSTDLTSGASGSILTVTADADFVGEFGLYALDDYTTPSVPTNTLDIFTMPVTALTMTDVYFKTDLSTTWASLDLDWSDTDNVDLGGNMFGFYYKGTSTTYYTDEALNSGNSYVISAYDGGINAEFSIDLDLDTVGTSLIRVNDVAPVPEPATMLLFGTGLAGLATLRRRKANK